MTREELQRRRSAQWKRLEALLREAEHVRGPTVLGPAGLRELAAIYRSLAADLMRVRRDKLGADLEARLDGLAGRAHNALYAGVGEGRALGLGTLLLDFPPALRRNGRFFLLALALFFGPMVLAGLAAHADEAYALAVLDPAHLEAMEQMHSRGHEQGRAADQSAQMTGFYVYNNVGIALRCFATGILFGLGPIYFLLSNALIMGVVFGHLIRVGYGENIVSFASAHGPWELTAIAISGAAGMQMGYALVATHGRTRLGNLQAHTMELLRQVGGAAAFLFLAAGIEAWVSPSSLPPIVKYGIGLSGWSAVFLLILLGGRRRPLPEDVRRVQGSAS